MGTCFGEDTGPADTYTFHFAGLCKPRWSKSSSHRTELNTIITVHSSLKSYDTILSLKRLIRKTYKLSTEHDVLILYAHHIISDNCNDRLTLKQLNVTNNALFLLAVIARRNEDDIDAEEQDEAQLEFSMASTVPLEDLFQQQQQLHHGHEWAADEIQELRQSIRRDLRWEAMPPRQRLGGLLAQAGNEDQNADDDDNTTDDDPDSTQTTSSDDEDDEDDDEEEEEEEDGVHHEPTTSRVDMQAELLRLRTQFDEVKSEPEPMSIRDEMRTELERLRTELDRELETSWNEEEKTQRPFVRADTPRYAGDPEEMAQRRPSFADCALARSIDSRHSSVSPSPLPPSPSLPQTVVYHSDNDGDDYDADVGDHGNGRATNPTMVDNEATRAFREQQLIEDFFALISDSDGKDNDDEEEDEEEKHDPSSLPLRVYSDAEYEKLRLRAMKGYDVIMLEHDVLCYRMQCGHLMNKESLYDYALSVWKDYHRVDVTCPHPTARDPTVAEDAWACPRCTYHNELRRARCEMCDAEQPVVKPYCGHAWQYKHMKRILAPTACGSVGDHRVELEHSARQIAKLTKLELLSARNKLQKDCNTQRCYKCDSLYVRRHTVGAIQTKSDLAKKYKTKCVFCYNTHFCFGCGAPFVDGHVCDNSFQLELVEILAAAELKNVGSVEQVPSIRCCPRCAQLITHTEACKHMDCKSCKTSFCFVCLKEKKNGSWQCGSHSDPCPAAPPQNIKTLPDAILVHKQRFKLF